MPTFAVVMGFVMHKGKLLFLKRSTKKSYYPGKWQMVTGHIAENEDTEKAVLREIKEETGLIGKIKYAGKSFEWKDEFGRFVIIPYIVNVETNTVEIGSEHTEHVWILPKDYGKWDCLPGMKEDLEAVKLL